MKRSRGFSLLELLIVAAIIAFIGTLGFANFVDQPKKARDAKRKTDLYEIKKVLEEYNTDTKAGCYPLKNQLTCGQPLSGYLSKIPCDPKTNDTYVYEVDPQNSSCPTSYWVYTKLEYSHDPDIKQSGCEVGCGPDSGYNYKVGSPNAR